MRKIISKVSKTVKNLAKKAAEKVNLFLVASIMALAPSSHRLPTHRHWQVRDMTQVQVPWRP